MWNIVYSCITLDSVVINEMWNRVYSCITLDSTFYLKSSENWTEGNAACHQEASTNNYTNENILLFRRNPGRKSQKNITKKKVSLQA